MARPRGWDAKDETVGAPPTDRPTDRAFLRRRVFRIQSYTGTTWRQARLRAEQLAHATQTFLNYLPARCLCGIRTIPLPLGDLRSA
jgi:hypothetical protein